VKSAKLKNKLLLSMLLTCTLIVLTVSFYQGYLRLERQKQQIQQEFISFENGAMNSIREAVWLYDWDMVQTIVENQTSKVITYAEICDRSAARCFKFGLLDNVPFLEHTSNISHRQPATRNQVDIGTVYLQAHYEPFSVSILRDLPELLLANGVSVFGVAVILFFLFHRQVVNRLQQVESYARAIDLNNIDRLSPLKVPENRYRDDEIDHLVDAINGMTAQIKDDLEQRQQLEQRLTQAQKMEALGTLAGGIAHDFNNQLSGVLGFADLIISKADNPELSRYAQSIKYSAMQSANLTQQLLAFGRKGSFIRQPIHIHKLLKDIQMILSHSLDKRIEVQHHFNAAEDTVSGDPAHLQSALLNIAINARDAMPEGGQLILTTEGVDLDQDFCSQHPEKIAPGRYLNISITDTGIGIAPNHLSKIFEPFFTTKKVGEGTGMGLSGAYATIERHGGFIKVQSQPGEGSTFMTYLPLSTVEASDPGKTAKQEAPVKGQGRILLVDDEEMVRNVAAEMLTTLGYKVFTCVNGAEALEYYQQHWQEIDLVILDMIMPKMNGYDTFKGLRDVNPEVLAILATGYSTDGLAQTILAEGCKTVISKPFEYAELSTVVADILQQHGVVPKS